VRREGRSERSSRSSRKGSVERSTGEPRTDAPPARPPGAALSASGESDARRGKLRLRAARTVSSKEEAPRKGRKNRARTRGTREVPAGRLTLQKPAQLRLRDPSAPWSTRARDSHRTTSVGRLREERAGGRRPESTLWVRSFTRRTDGWLAARAKCGRGARPVRSQHEREGRQRHAERRARGRNDARRRADRRSGPLP
jgi:hypothetical protein